MTVNFLALHSRILFRSILNFLSVDLFPYIPGYSAMLNGRVYEWTLPMTPIINEKLYCRMDDQVEVTDYHNHPIGAFKLSVWMLDIYE